MKRINYLVNYLNEMTKAYDEGNPLITDAEWDKAYWELVHLEKETGIILPNSPTQHIFYDVVNSLEKITHNHKMLSLDKTKDSNDIKSFLSDQKFLAMLKMDGLTCSLTYHNGKLISAETRGNGIVGENVLHNARIIPSIPKYIPFSEEITIDGEIICTFKDFEAFKGEYKNPRNLASGSIRLLDSKECEKRKLTFVAWNVITRIDQDKKEMSVDEKLEMIRNFGFTIVPYIVTNNFTVEIEIELKTKAEELTYPIDGLVYKFADCAYGRSLGETSHHFKDAIAYKFYDEVETTILRDIEWTMGRTQRLTPVAIFDPIELDGSTIEKASLHNLSIMRNVLKWSSASDGNIYPVKNQIVEVYKANAIIPQISNADFPESSNYEFIKIPSNCPICGSSIRHDIDGESEFLYCTNSNCGGALINRLDHFVGKKGLDIKGISKSTFEKLIEWEWINNIIDIFNLKDHREEWIKKSGFGVKSVDKILNAIEEGRICELNAFIAALGIPLIGNTASKELEKYFISWENFISAINSKFDFSSIPNFGYEMHTAIISFDYTEALELVDKYLSFAEKEIETKGINDLALKGKAFVITGKVNIFKNRDELKNKIESLGGKVIGSVSKNTDYLINNDVNSTSSKNIAAQSLNIPILSEEEFIQLMKISI